MEYICEKCGKLVTEIYGSGRFCSRKCANSHIHSNASKEKIKNTLCKYFNIHSRVPEKICIVCGKKYLPNRIKNGSLSKAKTCSLECQKKLKIKNGQLTQERLIKEGKHIGWTTRKIESYAEKFFKQVLKNNNIKYDFNKPIKKLELKINENGCYFLDFALANKIDLEIDGKQHKVKERQIHDKIRDERLIKAGWKVYRIEWKDLRKNKEYIKEEINKFLEWYNKNK